jgi:hypothetical protein
VLGAAIEKVIWDYAVSALMKSGMENRALMTIKILAPLLKRWNDDILPCGVFIYNMMGRY